MTLWLFWVVFSALALAAYHVTLKLASTQVAMPVYLMVLGVTTLTAGLLLGPVCKVVSSLSYDIKSVASAAIVALTVVFLEIGLYYAYNSSGYLSLTQPIITGIMSVTILMFGVFFLKEQLTAQQLFGIFSLLVGVFLITFKGKII